MSSAQHITRTGQFLTTVSAVCQLSPRMRRITLTDPRISYRPWPLGCDIAVVLTGADGRELRRRYTVRSISGPSMVIDAVLHGVGPGAYWAATVQVGDPVTFFGPRGQVDVPQADWVLAIADEAGLPAVAAVAEAMPAPIRVLAEIADNAERYPLPGNAKVTWLIRGERPAGSPEGFLAALDALMAEPTGGPSDHPPQAGRGYAYVLAESRLAVTLRDELSRFGLDRHRVYAKGYWNLNSRPTR